MSQVELRNIESTLGGNVVLRGLDFVIPPEILAQAPQPYVVFLGASGSGKSTTLKIIAGLQAADSGNVIIDGRDVGGVPARDRGVAMVFQQDALYPHLTIRETLATTVRSVADRSVRQSQLDQAIELTGIAAIVDRYPDGLSGGELRRAAIAKAIARNAPVRLLDEPLSALDGPIRHALAGDLKRWHSQQPGLTIHVTHDGDEAMRMADVIAVIDGGTIVQIAKPETIYDAPASLAVANAIGSPPINRFPAIIRRGKIVSQDERVQLGTLKCPQDAATDRAVVLAVRPDRFVIGTSLVGGVAADDWGLSWSPPLADRSWCRVSQGVQLTAPVGPDATPGAGYQGGGSNRDGLDRNWATAVLSPAPTVPLDGELVLSASVGDVHVFDASTGMRIEGVHVDG
ncbi:Maltose/maltodextrin import ATP-binding protein MalK [Rubripirellula lacrimiformis]|uniref:Maltose/maltodextrin import ATP-binding protein MalK n=1 Tax=Rubripirellula lacrimiformis TaxID=1930273 RepID=A0A517N7V2_9BACT|nr:ABC transporter ATP-binding protein [Rubripirellula lacrimiformis]QDT03190.1 Maltose/maltodextrin import ATP-binding protein MalK [Rubripirellula lacrimiformis]